MNSFSRFRLGLVVAFLVGVGFCGLLLSAQEGAAEKPAAGEQPPAASAKPIPPQPEQKEEDVEVVVSNDGKLLTFSGFTVDREKQEVRMDASVCLTSGILEYVVCLPETFEHEAIFVTDAKPELLHAALLLIGLKPTPQPPGMEVLWWNQVLKTNVSRVRVEVEWKSDGQNQRVNLSDMMCNREGDDYTGFGEPEPAPEPAADPDEKTDDVADAWVFAGSFMHTDKQSGKRIYAANLGGVLVGIWPNPTTIIQYGKPTGNPYRGDNFGMEVNKENVPAKGTKVKLVFSKFPKAELPKPEPVKSAPAENAVPEPAVKTE